MNRLVVTEAGPERIAAIMPVMEAAFDPVYGEAWTSAQCISGLALPDCWLLISELDGVVSGFAIARSVFDVAELMLIAVSPTAQRHGIGRALLDGVSVRARNKGAQHLFVEVRCDNPALQFYTLNSFHKVGERKNYYRRLDGLPSDAVTLTLKLS